jgi:NADH:ubiquinone oxidoreductase subunit 5 (subunit L)/multisubunit Na+/H+ antiporter MnhA subunit
MPRTGISFLIGAAAISALPPLNGFASEWMVFQAAFLSPAFPQWGLRFVAPAAGAILALSAALAAACFVKAFGITFLGRARRDVAREAREVDRHSQAAMFGLAGLCVVAGAVPGFFTRMLSQVATQLTSASMPAGALSAPWVPLVPVPGSHNSYGGLVILAFIVSTVALLTLLIKPKVRSGPAWDCGFPDPSPATQYSAGSFAQPIRRVFGTLAFNARERVILPPPGETAPASLEVSLTDPVWDAFYAPIGRAIASSTDSLNRLQFLTIRRYLGVVFLTLVVLLTVLVISL